MQDSKERIRILKKWKNEVEKSIADSNLLITYQSVKSQLYIPCTGLSKLEEMKKSKDTSHDNTAQLKREMSATSLHTTETQLKIASLKSELEVYSRELREVIRENVKLLLEVIFPITCEGLTSG